MEKSFEKNLFKDIEKDIGKKMIFTFGEETIADVKDWVSTGCWVLDAILGGGIPVGRVVEIYGPPASGKSSLLFSILSEFRKRNFLVILIDTETSYDTKRVSIFDLDPKKLFYAQVDTIEDVFDLMFKVLTRVKERGEGKKVVFGWDSIASTSTKRELEGSFGDYPYGIHAQMMSQGFRKIKRFLTWEGCTLVMTNQVRAKIGRFYGPVHTTFGGLAPQFYSSIRVEVKEREKLEKNRNIFGIRIGARTVKNKVFFPYKDCSVVLNFEKGFDNIASGIDYLVGKGIIKKGGGWFRYKDVNYRYEDLYENLKKEEEKFKNLIVSSK